MSDDVFVLHRPGYGSDMGELYGVFDTVQKAFEAMENLPNADRVYANVVKLEINELYGVSEDGDD